MPNPTETITPTILLLSLPPQILCSINLLSFTTTPNFHGIKNLPPGYHFIFTSETTSHSIRDGFWFHIPPTPPSSRPPLLVRKWDSKTGCLCPVDDEADTENYISYLGEVWEKGLMPYRQTVASTEAVVQESDHWAPLTRHVNARVLAHLTQNEEWRITSASSALVDRDEIPGLRHEEVAGEEERELGTLGIDLVRTWREGAVGRERTEGRLDRSWALGEVVGRFDGEGDGGRGFDGEEWGGFVLGQMEVCFLMVLTVANWSCLEEWKRILGLVLTCKRAVREREGWFGEFVGCLRGQVERCEDVEGGLFDMSDEGGAFLKGLLKGFKRALGQVFEDGEGEDVKEEMEALEEFLRREYGWELGDEFLRKGMLQLDDGEMVEMEMEEMEGEDERGEYAPVVVELDNP